MMQLGRFLPLIVWLWLSFMPAQSYAQSVVKEVSTDELQTDSEVKVKPSKEIVDLLKKLAVNQGKGQFTQQKHFSFMSVPITSMGYFIVKGESALWQTQQPVFSALLLTPDAIYRRLSLDENYQLLTDSAEFSAILSTIFTGKVNTDDWQLKSRAKASCLELTPKSGQLKQLFRQVDLCLVNEATESSSPQQQRQITLTDSKGDKTVITMTLSQDAFIASDLEALKRSTSQSGTMNAR
ncbi:hypothetical protein CXF71_14825 [Colwellia sp. 12G3]|nr:hypothetical protein CXF71_14825 [Colwellia sp. 12G3]